MPHDSPDQPLMRVLIVDDQPVLRQGMASLLELEDGVEVVGLAENGEIALQQAADLRPDVVLMDVRMPVMDGVRATEELTRRGGPPVVLLTTFEEIEDMTGGLNAGAYGYLFKSAEVGEILHAMRSAMRGERVIHPKVAQRLAQQLTRPRPTGHPPLEALTERELDVLRAVAEGHQNKRIAKLLGITEGTVKVHVSNALSKLQASNRTEAVMIASQLGLIKK